MVAVGWVEVRNPTATMVVLGFARLYPTYGNISFSEVVSVKQSSGHGEESGHKLTTVMGGGAKAEFASNDRRQNPYIFRVRSVK